MNITYTLNSADVVIAQKNSKINIRKKYKKSLPITILFVFMIFSVVGFLFSFIPAVYENIEFILMKFSIAIACGSAAFISFMALLVAGHIRATKLQKNLAGPFPAQNHFSANEENIELKTTHYKAIFGWGYVSEIQELEAHLAVSLANGHTIVIPYLSFKDKNERFEFCSFLRQRVAA